MSILTVLACCKEDVARAELLLDLIYQLDGRKAVGHGLIVFAPEVHAEMRDKVMISAAMAFESVEAFHVQKLITAGPDKPAATYAMFKAASEHVAHGYRVPWLWLEPDCLPLKPKWREALADGYENQPRRYMSRWLKADDVMFINRVGVYPVNITADMEIANLAQMPFEVSVVSKSTKSDLFQQLTVSSMDDVHKVRSDAVLLHSDKKGLLVDWVRSKAVSSNGHRSVEVKPIEPPKVVEVSEVLTVPAKRRGRPPKANPVTV